MIQTLEINLEHLRHSLAHLLAMAVLKEFPTAKLGVGPVVDNGFYYDFLLPEALTPEHLKTFQTTMRKLAAQNLTFEREMWPMAKALEYFKDQPFKLELIKEILSFWRKDAQAADKLISLSISYCFILRHR